MCTRMHREANPSHVMSAAMKSASSRATMRPSEMKTQSPSGSRGRAGVRISNLPPWLSLLCVVIYIKEEPAMQISMLALLGSRTGEARASVGTAPSNRHIQGMTRLDRCAGQDAEAGRPPIGMRVRMLQRDSSCRIRLLCGCRKPAGNILTIRMMYASLGIVSPDQGHLQRLIGQLGRRLFHA